MSRILRFGLLALLCAAPFALPAATEASPARAYHGRVCYAGPTSYRWHYHYGHGHRNGHYRHHR
jgi:hypothetical protein